MPRTKVLRPHRPIRAARHADLGSAIKDTAWKQIAESGAPTLSLRAIARELGVTAPAIYNYFRRRDDLVTALIKDAFADFGDSQLAAVEQVPAGDLPGRLIAAGIAYRQWALQHPERYQLIFGTPIPGYVCPPEVAPVSARSISALVGVLEGLRQSRQLRLATELKTDPSRAQMMERWKADAGEVDPQSFSAAVLIWARVHGLVSLEISRTLPPFGPSAEALYQFELESIRREFIREVI